MTTPKLSAEQKKAADETLGRLDKVAHAIEANFQTWNLPFETAKSIVNHLDKVADHIEVATYGEKSFKDRQVEILKQAVDVNSRRARLERYVTWTDRELAEFNEALAAQRVVDDELWD